MQAFNVTTMPHTAHTRPLPLHAGFTLIELLIAVVIVGVLMGIAMPAYQNAVRNARRVDAKGAVLDMATREEKFFAMNNLYSNRASDLGYPSLAFAVVSGGNSTSYYSLSVGVSADQQAYTATATPTGNQVADTTCYTYVVTNTGLKTNADANNAVLNSTGCW